MQEFSYKQRHIPSGKVYRGKAKFRDRIQFLMVLKAWNEQAPSIWIYYE
jgi:hypothetical protein